jgi:peptide/nickel transport system substrate-binding protein
MYTTNMTQPDPQIFIGQMVSWEVANKANKWLGRNRSRWQNAEFDALYREAEKELDPVKRAATYIKMNEILVGDKYIQPIVYRPKVTAVSTKLSAPISGWDNDLWQLPNWYREA